MIAKRLRRFSVSYVLLNNVHKNFARSAIKPTALFGSQYLSQRCGLTSDIYFAAKYFASNNFPIARCTSSQLVSGSLKMLNYLPFFVSGNIISGFGRGSKDLGIPTANYPLEVVKSLPDSFKTGVYFGWANVDNGPVYKMVMSIGWNPFYDNKEKSMETHILHDFNRDLYGCLLKICIAGYLRPEQNFNSLEDLVACIKDDIRQAEEQLESNEMYKQLQTHKFFQKNLENNTSSKSNSSE